MPKPILELLERSVEENREGLMAAITLHSCALDRGEIPQADKWLALSLEWQEHWPPNVRAGLFLEAAYMTARHHTNPGKAREWFTKAGKAPFAERSSLLSCEAAVLAAEGHCQESDALLAEAARLVEHSPMKGLRRMMVDRIADLERFASDRVSAGAAATSS